MEAEVRLGSLRLRLTLTAAALVLGVLIAGASLFFELQRDQLTSSVDRSLVERADTIADVWNDSVLSDSGLPASFDAADQDRGVQVVDENGVVIASSANLEDEGPIAELQDTDAERIRTITETPIGDDKFRVLSRRITIDGQDLVLHVAESTDELEDNTESLLTTLGVAVPSLTALLAGLIWWLVGRTLRPVDAMRSEVDSISDTTVIHQLAHPGHDDEIGRLTTTLNQMLERLHRSSAQQRQFVADAAHELRTPLTRIRTTVEVDLAKPDAASPDRTNNEVRDEAIGLQQLIDDLLHLARSDDGAAANQHSMLDLDDLVMSEIQDHRRSNPGVRIVATGVLGCEIPGDDAQLRRAIRNLVANATRHAESGVWVSLEQHDGEARLVIDDDGPGIEPDQRDIVFDRFTRLDESRSAAEGGAGLGLAITRDIVSRHAGTVHCEPSPRGGARFVATFHAVGDR